MLATQVANMYGFSLQKQWVKVKDPIAAAIPVYERLGFTLVQAGAAPTYYAKRVGP